MLALGISALRRVLGCVAAAHWALAALAVHVATGIGLSAWKGIDLNAGRGVMDAQAPGGLARAKTRSDRGGTGVNGIIL